MAQIRGEEIVARCLEREGVKSFFTAFIGQIRTHSR